VITTSLTTSLTTGVPFHHHLFGHDDRLDNLHRRRVAQAAKAIANATRKPANTNHFIVDISLLL
jgi:hypothetical protein